MIAFAVVVDTSSSIEVVAPTAGMPDPAGIDVAVREELEEEEEESA